MPRATGAVAPNEQRPIIGSSPAIRRIHFLIDKMGPTEEIVLIEGETGTGKDLIAAALYQASPRRQGPFVIVNCAALQENLLESELFGHEKGAFTSADKPKAGLFELADQGTLFIDEIGEMKLSLQAKLLRVLEDGRVRRVGATRWRQTHVRVLSATNKDLAREVADHRFRRDLYHRLHVLAIHVPPLRERPEDIPLLARHFLSLASDGARTLSLDAMQVLSGYSWPGNVRELQNVLRQARILAESSVIRKRDLPEAIVCPAMVAPPSGTAATRPGSKTLDDMEREHVRMALDANQGNIFRTAQQLGISRNRLYRLLQRHASQ